jgi:sigma-B regulation protein RsbU (phosphoserine phosphatase)
VCRENYLYYEKQICIATNIYLKFLMSKNKFNILYIDPSEADLHSFESQLGQFYHVHTTRWPKEARKKLRHNTIQLVIAEQELGESTGVEFLKSLTGKYPDLIKVVLADSRHTPEIIWALNVYTIHKYIIKPWDMKELKEAIDDGLQIFVKKRKNKRILTHLQYLLDQMNLVHTVSLKISEKKPLGVLLSEIMEGSKTVMNAEASSLLLYDPRDRMLYFKVATGEKGALVKKYSVKMGEGIAGWVAKHRKPLLIEDCYEDYRFSREFDEKTKFRTRSMVCVPLVRKRKLLGVMEVINKRDGGSFTEADLNIFGTLASQCAISIENAQLTEIQIESVALERELQTAREIQQRLLPASLPEFRDIEVVARLIPARKVGGDYYNVVKINDRLTLFFVADVSGKGVPAALIVSTIFSCLETYLNLYRDDFDLPTLVLSMNKALIGSTTPDKYATCWFGLHDHAENKLMSINAGHNPPYIFRRGAKEPLVLNTGGVFLGIMEVPFEIEEMSLQPHDVLVFFTDGVTEAWNKKEEDYGEHRLMAVVDRHREEHASEILSAIEEDVNQHVRGAPQSDDFTCAVVKILE